MKCEERLVEKVFRYLSNIVNAKESIDELLMSLPASMLYHERGLPFAVKKINGAIRASYQSSDGRMYQIVVKEVKR